MTRQLAFEKPEIAYPCQQSSHAFSPALQVRCVEAPHHMIQRRTIVLVAKDDGCWMGPIHITYWYGLTSQGRCNDPVISYDDASKLPYLHAAMYEALRILAPVSKGLPRYTPKGGVTINGTHFPEGIQMSINPGVIQLSKTVWGEDADQFRPERWLESEARSRYLEARDMTFGGNGPRKIAIHGCGEDLCGTTNLNYQVSGHIVDKHPEVQEKMVR